MNRILLIHFLATAGAGAVSLTAQNWDKSVTGKTVFVKFFAPWCGHCKKIKPDWDRLMADFKDAPHALVAEVDCTSEGKAVCEGHGIRGYPSLMWGKPGNLQAYNGERSYDAMKRFADDNLGSGEGVCSPGSTEFCDEKRKKLMEAFKRIPPEKLEEKINLAASQMQKAERAFAFIEHNATQEIAKAEEKKMKRIAAIRKKSGLPHKGDYELTPANWKERVQGKNIFVKFFAPWCGHCKAMKPDWDKLMATYEGTTNVLVGEVDCTGKGKPLCETHEISGFPKLLYGKAGEHDDLDTYSGGRQYLDFKMFAESHLGPNCGPENLELCDEDHRELMESLADMSEESRNSKIKSADKAIEKAEKTFFDEQFQWLAKIDKAEEKKKQQIQSIKDQGLSEAVQVQTWNKKQPPGFWKPPVNTQDPVLISLAGLDVTESQATIFIGSLFLIVVVLKFVTGRQVEKTCSLRHILTKTNEDIMKAKARIDSGEDFGEVAADCSTCPSGKKSGGSLGMRTQGTMNSAVDELCFDLATELGKVLGPVQSEYGFHLVVVEDRQGLPQAAGASKMVTTTETAKDK